MTKVSVSEVFFMYGMLNLISGALLYSEALGMGLGGRSWNNGRPDPAMKWPFIMSAVIGASSVLGALMTRDELSAVPNSPDARQVQSGIKLQAAWTACSALFWCWRLYALIPVYHLKQYALVFYTVDLAMSLALLAFLISRLPPRAKPLAPSPAQPAETKKDK